jgi:gluconokinase
VPGSVSIVVMGVSGSGKTTLARALAHRLGWPFLEGDDLHPPANDAKMARGYPLDDADRLPWLEDVAGRIGEQERDGRDWVLTCSALHRRYRDLLREGHPSVWFVHVTARPEVLRERLARRTGHFMPVSLLETQLQALEPLEPDEPGMTIDAERPPEQLVDEVLSRLGR